MSFVIAFSDALGTAASDLATIGSTLNGANAAAAAPTAAVLAGSGQPLSGSMPRGIPQACRHCGCRVSTSPLDAVKLLA
jgi:hypothetical protein